MGKVEDKVKRYLSEIKKRDGKIKAFLHLNKHVLEEARKVDRKKMKGRLAGYVFGVKSNINVKGQICNCASRVLEGYRSGFNATVIEKIRADDGVVIGMLNMDEFACGSSGESSAFGTSENPVAKGRICGGSSSGSAAAVAAGFCDVAVGSDTGGSIRNPASHCGVIGLKPSYGAVSRYGLIDLSMSLDVIGIVAKDIEQASLVLEVIRGGDERDTTSFDIENWKFSSASRTRISRGLGKTKLERKRKVKVGVVNVKGVDRDVQGAVDMRIRDIEEKLKWNVKGVDIKKMGLAVQTYYILVYTEFFSGTRRFDGRRFGRKIEDSCGEEVLRRILGGSEINKSEFSGAYYKKALGVKELIRREFERVLEEVDCLILPTVPVLPWKIGEGKKMKVEEIYAADALTCPANLAGVCGVSIPAGKVRPTISATNHSKTDLPIHLCPATKDEEIPVGMQVICGSGEDSKMLSIAREIEGLDL